MKKWKRIRKLLRDRRQTLVIGTGILAVILIGLVYVVVAAPWRDMTKGGSTHVTFGGTQKKQITQQTTSQQTPPQQAATDTVSANSATSTPKSSSNSSTQSFAPSPTPTPQSFAVSYVTLSQPNLVCSADGSYIAQIGDVIVGFTSASGGTVSYGFEASGDVDDTWGGYRQSGSVAAGTWSTTFNQMYWGTANDPHMAYTELIPWGHGAGAIRAVVYAPSTAYSSWFNVPAQAIDEPC